MQRREFIAGTATIAALGFAHPVFAQTTPSPGVKRIAIFHPTEPPEGLTINGLGTYKTFFGELNRFGYLEGQNLIVERYSALGRPDRYGDLARQIVASHPDLIVSGNGALALVLKSLTATIPIITASGDPVAVGLVTSLGRPGGNITGVSVDPGFEVWSKRLQLLSETASDRLTNVRVLAATTLQWWDAAGGTVREAAQRTGVAITVAFFGDGIIDHAAYERVFDAMEKDRVDGLMVGDAAEHVTNRQQIVDLAARYRLPTIYPFREFVEVGGLLSYGVDRAELMRRLAGMTEQVLRGAKPRDIPFYQLTKFELVLNRAAAKSLALDFPASLLAVADEVIE